MARYFRARLASSAIRLGGTGLLLTAVAIGCAGPAGVAPTPAVLTSATSGPGASPSSSEAVPSSPPAVARTPAPVARTPGPSVPRVAPLQPPAVASRISIASLRVDLPIVSGDLQPPPNYPYCDVAAYVTRFNQPYEPGITYISAHAQRGMFLPLLEASERNEGAELLGQKVDVYVSDGRLFTYTINRVVRHAIDYSIVAEIPLSEQLLILQTSEGPYGTIEKLQVIAELTGESAGVLADANPAAIPRDCEPAATP